mgnify:CR=1 FL=1
MNTKRLRQTSNVLYAISFFLILYLLFFLFNIIELTHKTKVIITAFSFLSIYFAGFYKSLSLEKSERTNSFKKTIVFIFAFYVFVMLVFCSVYFISSMAFMQTESKTGKNEYDKKGFVYSFLFYSVDSLVVEPDGYNSTVIDTIYDTVDEKYTGYDAPSNVQNVIVIQLESFCDILKGYRMVYSVWFLDVHISAYGSAVSVQDK